MLRNRFNDDDDDDVKSQNVSIAVHAEAGSENMNRFKFSFYIHELLGAFVPDKTRKYRLKRGVAILHVRCLSYIEFQF